MGILLILEQLLRMGDFVSLSERRQLFVNRVQQMQSIFQAAYSVLPTNEWNLHG
jgi:hypothetical protein